MANKNFTAILAVTIGLLLIILYLKQNEVDTLKKVIDENDNLNDEIKKKLGELIENNKEIDVEVRNELGQIAGLYENKHDNSALLKLAKIIENLLKELYKNNSDFKEVCKRQGKKNAFFADYLEFAKFENLITKEDYHLISVLKIIRNQEAHELDVKKERTRVIAAFISGMSLVLILSKKIKKNNQEPVRAL